MTELKIIFRAFCIAFVFTLAIFALALMVAYYVPLYYNALQ